MTERLAEAADALGKVQEEILRLKADEATLRAKLLTTEAAHVDGTTYGVSIQLQVEQRFDPSRLPPEIRNDPRYHKTSTTRLLTVKRKKYGDALPDAEHDIEDARSAKALCI